MASLLSSLPRSPSPSSPSSMHHHHRPLLCRASHSNAPQTHHTHRTPPPRLELSRRDMLTCGTSLSLLYSFVDGPAFGLLEADDDELLLQKVKEDRKKKIQKREELNNYKKETASVQAAIYNLSKAGQALDGNDLLSASSVLGGSLDVGWIADVKMALSKVSSKDDERTEAETFSSALSSLQSAVMKQDLALSKNAFVASASALEKWSNMTGFAQFLKGL